MKIKFKRSGGFANIVINKAVDVGALSPEKAEKLSALVTKLLPSFTDKVEEVKPDVQQYDVEVTDGDKNYHLLANDLTATEEMHELFENLLDD